MPPYVHLFICVCRFIHTFVQLVCSYSIYNMHIYIYIQHKDSKDLRVVEAGASPVRPGRIAARCLAVEEHAPQLHREDEPGAQPPFFKDAPQKKVQTV